MALIKDVSNKRKNLDESILESKKTPSESSKLWNVIRGEISYLRAATRLNQAKAKQQSLQVFV